MKVMVHTNCQFRDKHTVGGIVFYKHAFLVFFKLYKPGVLFIGHRQIKNGVPSGAILFAKRNFIENEIKI